MAIKKAHTDLSRLFKRLRAELPGLVLEPSCMRAPIETRYAALEVRFDYESQARALRIYVALPTPVGAGMEFLRWCLSMNTLYWDVKTGLDSEGRLLVLSDVDLDAGDERDWQVDEERPAPPAGVDEDRAERRSGGDRERGHAAPHCHRLGPRRGCGRGQQQGERRRHQQGRTDGLHDSSGDQQPRRGRDAA